MLGCKQCPSLVIHTGLAVLEQWPQSWGTASCIRPVKTVSSVWFQHFGCLPGPWRHWVCECICFDKIFIKFSDVHMVVKLLPSSISTTRFNSYKTKTPYSLSENSPLPLLSQLLIPTSPFLSLWCVYSTHLTQVESHSICLFVTGLFHLSWCPEVHLLQPLSEIPSFFRAYWYSIARCWIYMQYESVPKGSFMRGELSC
jgi:hypothetical protein